MNDPLYFNKVAAAILVALLLFFGLPQLASALFGGGHHGGHHGELKLAYPIEYEAGESGGQAAAELDLGTLMASATAKAGERRVQLCKSCHTFEKGGPNGTGPNLWNVVGRDMGSVERVQLLRRRSAAPRATGPTKNSTPIWRTARASSRWDVNGPAHRERLSAC